MTSQRHRTPAALAIFFFFATTAHGSLITSASCSVDTNAGPMTATGTSSCNVTGPDGHPNAMAFSEFHQSGMNSFKVTANAGAQTGFVGPYYYSGSSFSSILFSLMETTDGPVRQGLIRLVNWDSYYTHFGDGMGSSASSVGGLTVTSYPNKIPFTLGVPFLVELSAFAEYPATDPDDSGATFGSAELYFELYEADGVTPVNVREAASAPEPKMTLPLLLLAIAYGTCSKATKRRS